GLQYALESLKDFVPSRIFDSHLHLYRQADLKLPEPLPLLSDVAEVGAGLWRERVGRQSPNAQVVGGLFLPYPTATCDIARANEWLLAQLRAEPLSRGLLVISPRCDRARVDELARQPQIVGFKPYQLLSVETPTLQSSVGGFLPEWAWELADDRGLIIMLHLVRDKSMADPGNQEYIRSHCLKYPRARLILAHAARGFHARYTQTGITALRGLDNVWFDTAAVCEPQALSAVLHHFGPRKLLWGSDFPVSEGPSKCVSVADSFVWLDEKSVKWEELKIVCRPIPVGLESLLALKDAAEEFGLGREDLDDIFYRNALRLLGLWASAGAAASIISDFQKSGMMLPVQRGVAAEDGGQRGGAAGSLTQSLYRYAKTHRIPGGTQLLSKRPEMQAPDQWPAYFREARGCETWDLDGRHYFDMSFHGIGSCLLGFRDPDVTAAVRRRVNLGSMCTLNPPEEVELADLLCWLHPWAECVRYARCGGEIGAVAARIARATTKRSLVAICGYHGWQDWYLAANLGVTGALDGHL
ncbi:MAG: aminotransferase class III-fold pyridoxal phosphate-dependent enzyme, partial [Planctomycetes bacterium]|nr:aminotransferase class III-fold pyridoxal phosphate-dependent enzyme [Planctomycetota bacterium]